jgi:hypothetical protein
MVEETSGVRRGVSTPAAGADRIGQRFGNLLPRAIGIVAFAERDVDHRQALDRLRAHRLHAIGAVDHRLQRAGDEHFHLLRRKPGASVCTLACGGTNSETRHRPRGHPHRASPSRTSAAPARPGMA